MAVFQSDNAKTERLLADSGLQDAALAQDGLSGRRIGGIVFRVVAHGFLLGIVGVGLLVWSHRCDALTPAPELLPASDGANTCEGFFLMDGRSPVDLPETWVEARTDFRDICTREGLRAELCDHTEKLAFEGYPTGNVSLDISIPLCTRLMALGAAVLEFEPGERSETSASMEAAALVAAADALGRVGAKPTALWTKGGFHYGKLDATGFVIVFLSFSLWNSIMAFFLCAPAFDAANESLAKCIGFMFLTLLLPHVIAGIAVPLLVGGPGLAFLCAWPYHLRICMVLNSGRSSVQTDETQEEQSAMRQVVITHTNSFSRLARAVSGGVALPTPLARSPSSSAGTSNSERCLNGVALGCCCSILFIAIASWFSNYM